jgi:hypothetical protein
MDSEERRNALIGHTALCLMSLLGFLLYTATYSVVYMVKTDGKPIAVLEMWMVLTHLILSLLSCAIRAMGGNNTISEVQSVVFLSVCLAQTGLGTACMQDSLYCSIYYPAAMLPSLAASGSIAWSWVMYIASLGCQTGSAVCLGLGKKGSIAAAGIMGLLVPQVLSTLHGTCATAKWSLQCSQGASCSVPLNFILILVPLILSQVADFFTNIWIGIFIEMAAVAFLCIDILAIISVGKNGAMGIYIATMLILSLLPVLLIFTKTNPVVVVSHPTKIVKTGFRFPHLNLNYYREHDL